VVGTTTPSSCPAGSFRNTTQAKAITDCLICATGKYSLSTGSSQDCPACGAGFYCQSPTTIANCPLNTQSAAGSASLLNCICAPGFQCTYYKRISLVITLTNVSLLDLQTNVNNIRTNLIKAIAAAANVTVSQVNITGSSLHVTARRRSLLAVHPHRGLHHINHRHPSSTLAMVSHGVQVLRPLPLPIKRAGSLLLLDVFSDVHGSRKLSNLNHHLAKHKVPLHTWSQI
jgi:hypothetical protein